MNATDALPHGAFVKTLSHNCGREYKCILWDVNEMLGSISRLVGGALQI